MSFFSPFGAIGACARIPSEPEPPAEADYYVDTDHGSASDNNAGTEALPFKTIQKAANVATAGDLVYVKAGVYNEWVNCPNSGTLGNSIVFKAYPGDMPIIDGQGINVPSEPRWHALFYSYLKSYITLDGFEVRNSDEVLIRMMGYVGNYVEGLVVKNCKAHGNSNVTRNGIHMSWVNNGLIEGNEGYNTGWNVISTESCSNTPVRYNYVHDNSAHAGINVFPNTNEAPQDTYAGNDIIGNVVARITNPGAAIYTRYQINNTISHNVVYGCSTAITFDYDRGSNTYAYVSNTTVEYNTIANNDDYGLSTINSSAVHVRNNIFANNGSRDISIPASRAAGSDTDYNLFYGSMQVAWSGTTYTSVSSYSAATSNADNSLEGNPLFADSSNGDYSLLAGSPAINASENGTDMGAHTDPSPDPDPDPPYIEEGVTEAEDGTLITPMLAIADNAASSGYYVSSATNNSGTCTHTITIDTTGDYKFDARTYSASASQDSFFVTVDSETEFIWDINPSGAAEYFDVWRHSDITSRGSGAFDNPEFDPYIINLTAGDHTIVFRCRESAARLDNFTATLVP